jgi:23S rRNA pseudouridine2605 synthase
VRAEGALSLARALSKLGVCSRREAERWTLAGRIAVNGRTAHDPARWIDPRRDRLSLDGNPVAAPASRIVIALHKPTGCVTTRADPGGRPTVYDALGDVGRWVFPVGRLDRDSSGLLILTNDHQLGERLSSPGHHVPKTYHVRVEGIPDPEALRALREGLPLGDGTLTRPAKVRLLGSLRGARVPAPTSWLEVVLREGKNRQLRRMCAAVGHEVLQLVRVAIGRLGLGELAAGEWRELTPREVALLVGQHGRSGAACERLS